MYVVYFSRPKLFQATFFIFTRIDTTPQGMTRIPPSGVWKDFEGRVLENFTAFASNTMDPHDEKGTVLYGTSGN